MACFLFTLLFRKNFPLVPLNHPLDVCMSVCVHVGPSSLSSKLGRQEGGCATRKNGIYSGMDHGQVLQKYWKNLVMDMTHRAL